jgi:colanic acid biosynthesis glycosyl transferase WcaI
MLLGDHQFLVQAPQIFLQMRILLYSLNYAPELIGIGKYNSDFADWLTEHGHEVQTICALPYYPAWKIKEGYSSWSYCIEIVNKVFVYRCPIWIPAHPTGLKRIFHLISFSVSSLPVLLWRVLFWKPDIIFILEPPLFCLPSTLFVAKLARSKVWLHVQDFELDAGFSLNLIPKFLILKTLFSTIESFLMRQTDTVSTISHKMLDRLIEKKVQPEKCFLFPNWVDSHIIYPINSSEKPNLFREKLNISSDKIVCLYSGNIGKKQNLEHIIDVAKHLREYIEITFIIAGEGSEKANIAQKASNLSNVHLLPLQPLKYLNELLNLADIHLLPQLSEAADLVMPSKLQAMFASGRPVIATSKPNNQLSLIIEGRGIVVPPNDVNLMSQAIQALSKDAEQRARFGAYARDYAVTYWDRESVMTNFEFHCMQITECNKPDAILAKGS